MTRVQTCALPISALGSHLSDQAFHLRAHLRHAVRQTFREAAGRLERQNVARRLVDPAARGVEEHLSLQKLRRTHDDGALTRMRRREPAQDLATWEARRAGKECVSTRRSRGSPYP